MVPLLFTSSHQARITAQNLSASNENSYKSSCFKDRANKNLFSHLGPTCFAYLQNCTQYLLVINKTNPGALRAIYAAALGSSPTLDSNTTTAPTPHHRSAEQHHHAHGLPF